MKFTITLRGNTPLWERGKLSGFALLNLVFEHLKKAGVEFDEESIAEKVTPIASDFESFHVIEINYKRAKEFHEKFGWFGNTDNEEITVKDEKPLNNYVKPEINVRVDRDWHIKGKWVVDEESLIKALLDGRLEFEPSK